MNALLENAVRELAELEEQDAMLHAARHGRLLNESEAAEVLGLKARELSDLQQTAAGGPYFVRRNGRRFYGVNHLNEWRESHRYILMLMRSLRPGSDIAPRELREAWEEDVQRWRSAGRPKR